MRLFVDEDTGPGIAKALRELGFRDVDWVGKNRRIGKESNDIDWLRHVGQEGYLALSRNERLLNVDAECAVLIQERVGIVFLPQHMTALELMRLIFRKWEWLENIALQQGVRSHLP